MEQCKFCRKSLVKQRSDAKFCSDNCRVKNNQHQKQLKDLVNPLLAIIRKHEERQGELVRKQYQLEDKGWELAIDLAAVQSNIIDRQELLALTDPEFRQKIVKVKNVEESFPELDLGKHTELLNKNLDYLHSQYYKEEIKKALIHLRHKEKQWQEKIKAHQTEEQQLAVQIAREKAGIQQVKQQIEMIRIQKQQQSMMRKKRRSGKAEQLESQSEEGISMREFLAINFETFTLSGNLGAFLGELERHQLSIALTGDAGAGKSYLLGAITQLLSKQKLSVCYYQLELGLGRVFQQILKTYPANMRKVSLKGQATLEEVRASANLYDCIVIDSFGKASEDYKAFDSLRKDFPSTIFVSIFQKTSQGSMRGGARIDFDSSMIIDVVRDKDEPGRPIAMMRKSRYGTQGWQYDVKVDQIIRRLD